MDALVRQFRWFVQSITFILLSYNTPLHGQADTIGMYIDEPEIIISATKMARTQDQLPIPVQVIGKKEIQQTAVGRVSRMDALQQQAMAQAAQQRRHIQLQRIESALQRLENGKFGWCVRCGEEISRKRLDVDPTAPLCIACADGRSQ